MRSGDMGVYPDTPTARDQFVRHARSSHPVHDPWRAHAVTVEDERTETGAITRVATVFLTGRECPWACVMCDLWRYTTETTTPPGAIAAQVRRATQDLTRSEPTVTRLKLYNAGSFFDPRAVPLTDYDEIAAATRGYSRIVVESHPSLIGTRTQTFLAALRRHHNNVATDVPPLEVAIGLETTHPIALERLNKRMTVDDVQRAAARLLSWGAAVRIFLLVGPPFIDSNAQEEWLVRSVETAFACGATAVSLIPTRHGNGAMDRLLADGTFHPPHLHDVERALALAMERPRPAAARVCADLWDIDRFASCPHCLPERRERLRLMNLDQRVQPAITCGRCDGGLAQ